MKFIKVDDNVRKLKMLLEARQRLKGLLSGGRQDFEETETEYVDDTRFNAIIIVIIYNHQFVISIINIIIIMSIIIFAFRNINVTLGRQDIKADISAAQEVFLPPPVSKVKLSLSSSSSFSKKSPSSSS